MAGAGSTTPFPTLIANSRRGKKLRAQLYAWLATRESPSRMGLAIGAGNLRVDNELSEAFADWLRRLFL